MKKIIIIGAIGVVLSVILIVTPLLIAIIPVAGSLSFTELIMSQLPNDDQANQLWLDIDNDAVREIIETTDSSEYDKQLFSKEDIISYLEYEDATYSRDNYSYKKKSISEDGQATIENLELSFKDIEFEYRLPWQSLAIADFLNDDEEITFEMIKTLKPNYSYYYPEEEVIKYEFTNSFSGIRFTKLFQEPGASIDNRQIIKNSDLSVYYKNKPYSAYTEAKRVEINKYFSRNTEGKYEVSGTDTSEYIETELTDPIPFLVNVRTPYKNVDLFYEKEYIDKIGSSASSTTYEFDGEGNRIGKAVITTTDYYKAESVKLDKTDRTDLSTGFDEFSSLMNFDSSKKDLFVDLVSLLPGGFMVARDMTNVQSEGKKLSILSSFMGVSSLGFYANIEISPSELMLPIPRFYQNDARWAKLPFGRTTMEMGACGPTSAAMVLTGINKKVYNPFDIATKAAINGYQAKEGLKWSFFKYIGEAEGIEVAQLEAGQVDKMLEALKKGNPVIASMKPGHFTDTGHFIVLTHITADGLIMVNDPSDRLHVKNRPWNPLIVIDESKQYWIFENNQTDVAREDGDEDKTDN